MLDTKKFMNEKFTDRVDDVPVPDMAQWFPEGDPVVWKVRGLTGKQLGLAKVAAARNKSMEGMLNALQNANVSEKLKGIQALFDLGPKSVAEDTAVRIELFTFGSVEPKGSLDLALKVLENFPIEFGTITKKISDLTGQGRLPGKPKRSGKKAT